MQVLNRTLPTNTAKKTIFHQILIDTRGLTQSIEQNKEGETSAEVGEGRVLIKENSQQTVADWTQEQESHHWIVGCGQSGKMQSVLWNSLRKGCANLD